ncbi:LysR substrate-binding domain-containing protein [Thauera sinica]|uniref:LysR substrate-binding domain-containing protein n=1 Tax=Thauera sinica TaxID=2665146 RepID=A0ABW1AXT4_9RHOO|nr:LysR substrate-binding domain-containing protein [Thauera sp. K11]
MKALVAFDAAMRTGSFSLAAAALFVTPGAVGQQIQKLEEWLGVALFVRRTRQVQPTEAALAYWQRIQPALAQIVDASDKLRNSRSMAVSLSMPPGFAAQWFTRRMAGLLRRHPAIELHLNATPQVIDFEREPIDLAIRYFDGRAPDLDATLLLQDEGRAYGNPRYLASLDLRVPDDLTRATLLVTTLQPHWPAWLRACSGLPDARIDAIPRIHFDQSLTAIEAARQGQGVVMTSPHLVEAEVAAGSLVEPFAHALPLSQGYYVVHHRRLPLRPAAAAVRQWLIDEANGAGRERDDLPPEGSRHR